MLDCKWVPREILISAGEASSDRYAAMLVDELRRVWPDARFFGCAGPRMRAAGVDAVIEAESLAVVGLVEVVAHLPRIWRQYQKLVGAARKARPQLAILTDSPDFHLRRSVLSQEWHCGGVHWPSAGGPDPAKAREIRVFPETQISS